MRLLKHLFVRSARRLFPEDRLQRVAQSIARDETRHRGEVCFAVESGLGWRAVWAGQQARDRAGQVFSQLRVWDTAENNGILIYLLLADRRIEILADRGLDGLISDEQWRGVCQLMEERLRAGDAEAAVLEGVVAAGDLLAGQFPRIDGRQDINELPDRPRVID